MVSYNTGRRGFSKGIEQNILFLGGPIQGKNGFRLTKKSNGIFVFPGNKLTKLGRCDS